MFEDYTYERLLQEVLDNAPEDIDTRQGSVFYDAVSGPILKIAKLYTDLDLVVELTSIITATGEALDTKASEYGMTRLKATKAKYRVTFEGMTPPNGTRFYYDGRYFVLKEDLDTKTLYLEAEIAGESGNDIYSGTPAIPVNSMPGLKSATFGTLYESGTDDEEDEPFRKRVQEKIAGPAENGNKQHYKTWCESVDGVGRARIFPLWNGPNTVKAVLIDGAGQPLGPAKVAEVQRYVDPADLGQTTVVNGKTYVVGDGLGEGVANLGAHFTAVAATALTVNVSFRAEVASGSSKETVQSEATEAIKQYFVDLVLNTEEATDIVVRLSHVGAMLSELSSLLDYTDLKLNGKAENITPGEDDVPVIGEVTVL